jgi:ribose-phosphate pyrophosphokinase
MSASAGGASPRAGVPPPPSVLPLLFALAGSERLGEAVAAGLGTTLAPHEERDFERGEHKSRPLASVRQRDVTVIHQVHGDVAGTTANDRLVRLWLFLAALRDGGARSLTVVVPYLPYSRKDRRTKSSDPVSTRYVAQLFEAVGAGCLVCVEPHNLAAFENAFRIPTVPLPLAPLVADWLAARAPQGPLTIVSPDIGGVKRAQQLAAVLAARGRGQVGLAFMEKRRSAGVVGGETLVGEVAPTCLLVDDLASSGGTLARAAARCRERGATQVVGAVAHALLTPGAPAALGPADFDTLLATDSVPVPADLRPACGLETLPIAAYLAAALRCLWHGESIAELTEIDA